MGWRRLETGVSYRQAGANPSPVSLFESSPRWTQGGSRGGPCGRSHGPVSGPPSAPEGCSHGMVAPPRHQPLPGGYVRRIRRLSAFRGTRPGPPPVHSGAQGEVVLKCAERERPLVRVRRIDIGQILCSWHGSSPGTFRRRFRMLLAHLPVTCRCILRGPSGYGRAENPRP